MGKMAFNTPWRERWARDDWNQIRIPFWDRVYWSRRLATGISKSREGLQAHAPCTLTLSALAVLLILIGFTTSSMAAKAAEANGKATKSIPSTLALLMIFRICGEYWVLFPT